MHGSAEARKMVNTQKYLWNMLYYRDHDCQAQHICTEEHVDAVSAEFGWILQSV